MCKDNQTARRRPLKRKREESFATTATRWNCEACTFINESAATNCLMCGGSRNKKRRREILVDDRAPEGFKALSTADHQRKQTISVYGEYLTCCVPCSMFSYGQPVEKLLEIGLGGIISKGASAYNKRPAGAHGLADPSEFLADFNLLSAGYMTTYVGSPLNNVLAKEWGVHNEDKTLHPLKSESTKSFIKEHKRCIVTCDGETTLVIYDKTTKKVTVVDTHSLNPQNGYRVHPAFGKAMMMEFVSLDTYLKYLGVRFNRRPRPFVSWPRFTSAAVNKDDSKRIVEFRAFVSASPREIAALDAQPGWSCTKCTFMNKASHMRCEMCSAARITVKEIGEIEPSTGRGLTWGVPLNDPWSGKHANSRLTAQSTPVGSANPSAQRTCPYEKKMAELDSRFWNTRLDNRLSHIARVAY